MSTISPYLGPALDLLAAVLALVYGGWQMRNYFRWQRREGLPKDKNFKDLPTIAIIVPFRNEADNLPALLTSLRGQDYPAKRYEVILVDDHSTDGGEVAGARWGGQQQGGFRLRILSLQDHLAGRQVVAHKKAALSYGIEETAAEIILTTDADCTLPSDLLSRVAQTFSTQTDVALGPVLIGPGQGLLHAFQVLDLAGYQLYTAAMVATGAPGLANGACLAFRRERFLTVDGYAGVDHLPSGDDVLLLHKFNAAGYQAAWLPGQTPVYTQAVTSWSALWRQRLRWASKAGSYVHPGLQFGQALAFLTSLLILLLLFTFPLHLRPRPLLLLWGTKFFIDLVLLFTVTKYYRQLKMLLWYPLVALIYPFYLVAVGTAALLGIKAGWKGR
ncbi:MAG: glycosyltransferase [Bacteroidota bacterium]